MVTEKKLICNNCDKMIFVPQWHKNTLRCECGGLMYKSKKVVKKVSVSIDKLVGAARNSVLCVKRVRSTGRQAELKDIAPGTIIKFFSTLGKFLGSTDAGSKIRVISKGINGGQHEVYSYSDSGYVTTYASNFVVDVMEFCDNKVVNQC